MKNVKKPIKKLTKEEKNKVRNFADLILEINGFNNKKPKYYQKLMSNGKAIITIAKDKKEQIDREKRFKKVLSECKKIAKLNGYELEEISLLNKKKYE